VQAKTPKRSTNSTVNLHHGSAVGKPMQKNLERLDGLSRGL